MFTKCFELLGKKKKNVLVGTGPYLPRYTNSSRFHPPAARIVPSLYTRLGSPINPVFPASCRLLPAQVGSTGWERSKLFTDSLRTRGKAWRSGNKGFLLTFIREIGVKRGAGAW